MQQWLRDRGQPVPEAESAGMNDDACTAPSTMMLMPGMLTAEQMKRARPARGPGVRPALPDLHDPAPPGRRDDGEGAVRRPRRRARTRRCSSSRPTCNVDQTTEIARMQTMLAAMLGSKPMLTTAVSTRSVRLHLSLESLMASVSVLGSLVHARARRGLRRLVRVVDRRQRRRRRAQRVDGRRAPIRASGCAPGLWTPREATWNLRVVSTTPPPRELRRRHQLRPRVPGNYAIQGNYNGYQVWDISNPAQPTLMNGVSLPGVAERRVGLPEPALRLGRGTGGRLDCGAQGVPDTVSKDRLRGIRIFDITDITQPAERRQRADLPRLAHAHACWSTRTTRHNVYVYISGSAPVRSPSELPGCSDAPPDEDPELGAVPHRGDQGAAGEPGAGGDRELAAHLQRPGRAAARTARRPRTSPRARPPRQRARSGAFIVDDRRAETRRCRRSSSAPLLDSIVERARRHRRADGAPTAPRCARRCPSIDRADDRRRGTPAGPRPGPTQCHDITVYPAIGLAGGACEGYGLLLDIRDPANPTRHRRRGRLELLLLALGDVQQRRHQDPVHRRVGRRRRSRSAARPIRRSGAPTRSSRSRTATAAASRATTSCRRRRRRRRTASRTTAR